MTPDLKDMTARWVKLVGYWPDNRAPGKAYGRIMKGLKELVEEGYTWEEIEGCVQEMKDRYPDTIWPQTAAWKLPKYVADQRGMNRRRYVEGEFADYISS